MEIGGQSVYKSSFIGQCTLVKFLECKWFEFQQYELKLIFIFLQVYWLPLNNRTAPTERLIAGVRVADALLLIVREISNLLEKQ
jgi:hypothetical protein